MKCAIQINLPCLALPFNAHCVSKRNVIYLKEHTVKYQIKAEFQLTAEFPLEAGCTRVLGQSTAGSEYSPAFSFLTFCLESSRVPPTFYLR